MPLWVSFVSGTGFFSRQYIISLQTGSPLYSLQLCHRIPMFSSTRWYFYSHVQRGGGAFRKNTGCSNRNGTEGTPALYKRHSSHRPGFFSSRKISKRMKRLLREFPQTCYCFSLVKNFEPLGLIREMEFFLCRGGCERNEPVWWFSVRTTRKSNFIRPSSLKKKDWPFPVKQVLTL